MTVRELIERLQEFDGGLEVAPIDGFNGGGHPRTLNFGPVLEERSGNGSDRDTSDLQDTEAAAWVAIGFGYY